MHLYVMTRGIKHNVDRFVEQMSSQYFPYKWKEQNLFVQCAMRPIQLWEIVMPEESLDVVQKTLWGTNEQMKVRPQFKAPLYTLRKTLGAQKIPKFDEKVMQRIVFQDNVCIYPIGIRPDTHDPEDGHENL